MRDPLAPFDPTAVLLELAGVTAPHDAPAPLSGMPFHVYAGRYLRILTKRGRIAPLVLNRVQRHFLDHATRRDLVLKARQVGVSTAIQGRFYQIATTQTAVTATLSHEDDSTQRLRRMADRFHQMMPRELRPARKYANSSVTTYPDTHSEANIATAANVNTGRAGSHTHIHCSEVAFYRDAGSIMAGMLQAGDPDWIVMESTPNGAQGYFYDMCMEALEGEGQWRLHFYPWWWEPAYTLPTARGESLALDPEEEALRARLAREGVDLTDGQVLWRRAKRVELKHLFPQEYPEDPVECFLTSGSGFFGVLPTHALEAPLDPAPDPQHAYVAGLDFGQSNDYTALSVVDVTAGVEVARLRMRRMPWAEMRRRVVDVCHRFGVTRLDPELNSMGGTNIEELRRELAERHVETDVVPFNTDAWSKARVMGALHEALHSGALRLQHDVVWDRELRAFTSKQTATGHWRLEGADGEHDDTVIARALAWNAAGHVLLRPFTLEW